MAEELKELPGPYEIFELADGESKTLQVTKWELGTAFIKTREVPEGKTIKVLRVYVTTAVKPIGVGWWDITSGTLIAQVLPFLEKPDFTRKKFTIKKYGVAPKARFTVEVST